MEAEPTTMSIGALVGAERQGDTAVFRGKLHRKIRRAFRVERSIALAVSSTALNSRTVDIDATILGQSRSNIEVRLAFLSKRRNPLGQKASEFAITLWPR